MISIVSIFSSN